MAEDNSSLDFNVHSLQSIHIHTWLYAPANTTATSSKVEVNTKGLALYIFQFK